MTGVHHGFFGVNDLINLTFEEHGHYNYSSGLTKGNFLYTTILDIQVSISGVLRGLSSKKGGDGTSDQISRQWLKARKGVV